jgi:single-strand DNA-binding protein
MNFEITGKLYEIYPTNQKTDKFRSREFVLVTSKMAGDREVVDYVKFQTTNDRCDLLNKYNVGSEVTVHFNIRGNRWENAGKVSYFTNLDAWRIEGNSQEQPAPQTQAEQEFDRFGDKLPF